ncbi:hypothetical protein D3C77_634180 [compost metagenome]
MPRKLVVRKKPTALWPYHHCTMASCTPAYAEYDFHIDTGISMLLKMCRMAMVRMYEPKNQLAT